MVSYRQKELNAARRARPAFTSMKDAVERLPCLLSKNIPKSLPDYPNDRKGRWIWNEGWNKYLEKEYSPTTPHPSISSALVSPYIEAMESMAFGGVEEQRSAAIKKQKLLADRLAGRYGAAVVSRTFQRVWLTISHEKREDGLIYVLSGNCSEANYEWLRRLCPETFTPFLLQDGGRGFLNLLSGLVGNLQDPRMSDEPVFLPHSVFDKIWSLDSSRPLRPRDAQLLISYRAFILLSRTTWLCEFARDVIDHTLDILHVSPSPRSAVLKECLQKDKRDHILSKEQREKMMGDWKKMKRFCDNCNQVEDDGSSILAILAGPFMHCAPCNTVGRKVVYCSKDCQRAHWKFHKVLCGKPLGYGGMLPAEPTPLPTPPSRVPTPDRELARYTSLDRQRCLNDGSFGQTTYWIRGYKGIGGEQFGMLGPFGRQKFVFICLREIAFYYREPHVVAQMCIVIRDVLQLQEKWLLFHRTPWQLSEEYGIDFLELIGWMGAVRGHSAMWKAFDDYVQEVEARQTVD